MSLNHHSLVGFFREAAPYIHMHRGKTFVIAISGSVLQHEAIGELLSDVALLSKLGARIILVLGARPQVEAQLAAHKHKGLLHNGFRITDDVTLELSKAAIGAARLEIENHLNRALNRPPIVSNSLGVVSGNFLTAKPIGVIDGIDHSHTGRVRKVNQTQLEQLLANGNIVLLSPLGYSPTGQIYNLLFEEVAGFTANKLKADKLIFIHDNTNLPDLPKQLNLKQLDEIKDNSNEQVFQEISQAIHHDVERAHLIEISTDGGLLLELYTRDGAGIMIDNSQYDEPRQATIDDVGGIMDLIQPLEEKGVLTKRSRTKLELDIANFSVIERDGEIIGCAALYKLGDTDIAELACLTINKDYRHDARGTAIVNHLVEQAIQIGISKIIVLTTQSTDWFKEHGFIESNLDELPSSRKKTYNPKRKSKILTLKIR
jgi:amino-acid N-acetyltransferase